jgi:hypothetical protein
MSTKVLEMVDQPSEHPGHFDIDHWRVGPPSSDNGKPKAAVPRPPADGSKPGVLSNTVSHSQSCESDYDLDHWRIGPKNLRAASAKC